MTKSLVLPIRELVFHPEKSLKSPERNSKRVTGIVKSKNGTQRKERKITRRERGRQIACCAYSNFKFFFFNLKSLLFQCAVNHIKFWIIII